MRELERNEVFTDTGDNTPTIKVSNRRPLKMFVKGREVRRAYIDNGQNKPPLQSAGLRNHNKQQLIFEAKPIVFLTDRIDRFKWRGGFRRYWEGNHEYPLVYSSKHVDHLTKSKNQNTFNIQLTSSNTAVQPHVQHTPDVESFSRLRKFESSVMGGFFGKHDPIDQLAAYLKQPFSRLFDYKRRAKMTLSDQMITPHIKLKTVPDVKKNSYYRILPYPVLEAKYIINNGKRNLNPEFNDFMGSSIRPWYEVDANINNTPADGVFHLEMEYIDNPSVVKSGNYYQPINTVYGEKTFYPYRAGETRYGGIFPFYYPTNNAFETSRNPELAKFSNKKMVFNLGANISETLSSLSDDVWIDSGNTASRLIPQHVAGRTVDTFGFDITPAIVINGNNNKIIINIDYLAYWCKYRGGHDHTMIFLLVLGTGNDITLNVRGGLYLGKSQNHAFAMAAPGNKITINGREKIRMFDWVDVNYHNRYMGHVIRSIDGLANKVVGGQTLAQRYPDLTKNFINPDVYNLNFSVTQNGGGSGNWNKVTHYTG